MSEIPVGQDLVEAIQELKRRQNAVILAHYYQDDEIQDIADYIGDSLGLSQQAKAADVEVIAFAGVHFMAETAKILNPDRTVVVPDLEAGCSLADSCPDYLLEAWKQKHPEHWVISYINCTAATKALSDIICTSANAIQVAQAAPAGRPILFGPDRYLGKYVMRQTGLPMDLWNGTCIVHESFSLKELLALKLKHPGAIVLAHPECPEPILGEADVIGSTTGLLKAAKNANRPNQTFIVATEPGLIHQMEKEAPGHTYIPLAGFDETCACNQCPYMRLNTLEKLYLCLRDLKNRVELPAEIIERARIPIERMLAL